MRAQGSRDRSNLLRRCQSGDGGVGCASVLSPDSLVHTRVTIRARVRVRLRQGQFVAASFISESERLQHLPLGTSRRRSVRTFDPTVAGSIPARPIENRLTASSPLSGVQTADLGWLRPRSRTFPEVRLRRPMQRSGEERDPVPDFARARVVENRSDRRVRVRTLEEEHSLGLR